MVGGEGWLFFVLWTTFFSPTFSFSPITDCPSLGQILFMILEEEEEEGVVGPP